MKITNLNKMRMTSRITGKSTVYRQTTDKQATNDRQQIKKKKKKKNIILLPLTRKLLLALKYQKP